MPVQNKPKRIPFKDWLPSELEIAFNLKKARELSELTAWITVNGTIPAPVKPYIDFLSQAFSEFCSYWNELELFSKFISPFLETVQFYGDYYNNFSGRKIKTVLGSYELYGETDWMVAFGREEPKLPLFFIHEYKRTKGAESDPLGQLLAAMIAAQHLNQNNKPLYGAYILGNIWYFVVLIDKTYAISTAYDALDADELTQIWLILHKRKLAIEAEVETLVKNRTILP